MSKFDKFKKIISVKSRTNHICNNCSSLIRKGELYYKENIEDKFLQSLSLKKFCFKCYEDLGDSLLFCSTKQKKNKNDIEHKNLLDLFS